MISKGNRKALKTLVFQRHLSGIMIQGNKFASPLTPKNIPKHQNVSGIIYQQLASILGINCKKFAVEPLVVGAEKQEIIMLLTAVDLQWNITSLEQNV